jgi:hypothetical protein
MNEFLKENRYFFLLVTLIAMFLATSIHGYHDSEPQLAKESFDLVKQLVASILAIMAPHMAKAAAAAVGNGNSGGSPPNTPTPPAPVVIAPEAPMPAQRTDFGGIMDRSK